VAPRGAAAGLLLSWWAHAALTAWLAGALRFIATDGVEFTVDPSMRMAVVTVGLAAFSTVCFALGPAWRLSRPSVTADLKDEPWTVGRRFGSGMVPVAIQLTVSLGLLGVGGLFVRSALEVAAAGPGFAIDRLLVFAIDPSFGAYDEARTRDLYRSVLQRVDAIPGIEQASLASKIAFGEFVESGFVTVPERKTQEMTAGFTIVTSAYFETLGLPVLRGRSFTHEEDERAIGTPPAVISRTLARRLFADDDPLGRQVMLRQGSSESGASGHGNATATLTVVGIVPDTTQDILDLEPNSQIYLPFGSRFRSAMWLQATIGAQADEAAMLTSVQRELRRLDEQLPILSARTLAAQRDLSVPRWAVRAAALIFAMFGALALLIAAIGVYGLVAYDVARRTRELGIRMALGATSTDVTRLVLRQGLTAAAVGVSVGLLLAAGIGQVVSSLLYEVSPLDPVALCGAVLVLLGSTLVACYGPARRATRIATVDALRAD
jgi:predicted permease